MAVNVANPDRMNCHGNPSLLELAPVSVRKGFEYDGAWGVGRQSEDT